MKLASTISRYSLGLIFLVFGLNGFLHFIRMPAPPPAAGQFFSILSGSHYAAVLFALQVVTAVLLLIGRYVPLALAVLAAIIFNILCIHIFMAPSGLPLAIIVTILWILTFLGVRSAFAGLFQERVAPQAR